MSILEPLLCSLSYTYNLSDEREALQWATADYRAYWDCISACCSWLAGEEQWLQNAVTINHPERPVWYGHSQQECGGDGLMSAQHGWSYQQITPQQGHHRLYLQHQHESLFLHLKRWFMNETGLFSLRSEETTPTTTSSVSSSTTQHAPTTHRYITAEASYISLHSKRDAATRSCQPLISTSMSAAITASGDSKW